MTPDPPRHVGDGPSGGPLLHFFPRANGVEATPFGAELRRLGVRHRFFGGLVNLRYRSRLGLLFGAYPRLAWFALRRAVPSLLFSRPAPDAAIVGSDVEALVFGCLRALFRRRTLLVFHTLLISDNRGRLYRLYYALILSLVDLAVCHSSGDLLRYARIYPRARCRFVFVPFGTTVTRRRSLMAAYAATGGGSGAVVAAGRSGRDYGTLLEAVRGLDCTLRIICDLPLPGMAEAGRVTVIRDCFDDAYLTELANALLVVVPLSRDDKSAGQMVLLQAAALGKPIVVSRAASVAEYVADGEEALLVEIGDVAQMRAAIRRLLQDGALRARLGANAARRFEREHSTEAYVRKLVAAVRAALAERRG